MLGGLLPQQRTRCVSHVFDDRGIQIADRRTVGDAAVGVEDEIALRHVDSALLTGADVFVIESRHDDLVS